MRKNKIEEKLPAIWHNYSTTVQIHSFTTPAQLITTLSHT